MRDRCPWSRVSPGPTVGAERIQSPLAPSASSPSPTAEVGQWAARAALTRSPTREVVWWAEQAALRRRPARTEKGGLPPRQAIVLNPSRARHRIGAACPVRPSPTAKMRAHMWPHSARVSEGTVWPTDASPTATARAGRPAGAPATPEDPNTCVPAQCRVNSDCGKGGDLLPSGAGPCYGGVTGYYCHSAADTCTTDADCWELRRLSIRGNTAVERVRGAGRPIHLPGVGACGMPLNDDIVNGP